MTPGLFSTQIPGLQLAWDATSLALFAECPTKYKYAMIDGWRGRGTAPPLEFGRSWHRGLETRDRELAKGASRDEALISAIQDVTGQNDSDGPADETERKGFTPGDDDRRTFFTLVRSLVWYDHHYSPDPAQLYWVDPSTPAIELSFQFDTKIKASNGEAFSWCGHIDKVVTFAENLYIMEYKHTVSALGSYYFERYKPNIQVEGYYFGASVVLPEIPAGVIVDATEVKITFTKFQRHIVPLSAEHREEFHSELVHWMKLAEEFATSGHYPMNKTACTSKFGNCPYKAVCSKNRSVRPEYLRADYKQLRWDPLKVRGVDE